MTLADQIDDLLPQTQCGQCGYAGCRPYAEAVAEGEAINKCPPGGEATVQALAGLLERPSGPLDPAHGQAQPPTVAYIREDECIGCTKCIQACPVDAILGAAQQMHTVIEDECTGCELCVEPCPVDCIDMVAAPERPAMNAAAPQEREQARRRAHHARKRYQARQKRLATPRHGEDRAKRTTSHRAESGARQAPSNDSDPLARARAKKAQNAAPDALKTLRNRASTADKRYKEALAALKRAEHAQAEDLTELRARVRRLEEHAQEAERALQQARQANNDI